MFSSCTNLPPSEQLDDGAYPVRFEARGSNGSPYREDPTAPLFSCGGEGASDAEDEIETLASRDARAREAAAALLNVAALPPKRAPTRRERPSGKADADARGQEQKSRYNNCSVGTVLDMCDHRDADLDADSRLVRHDYGEDEEAEERYLCMR
mmetsp:Transcript_3825/g.12398  ORF Transcript_3825/g.12398 Transcript_3825/m.12398 type:complete len:153 (+) Transcript_3825:110-568(+)